MLRWGKLKIYILLKYKSYLEQNENIEVETWNFTKTSLPGDCLHDKAKREIEKTNNTQRGMD